MTLETSALIPEWPHESARNSFRNEFPCRWVSKQSLVSRFETFVDRTRFGACWQTPKICLCSTRLLFIGAARQHFRQGRLYGDGPLSPDLRPPIFAARVPRFKTSIRLCTPQRELLA